ncbi:hypothetical protein BJ322DRAFT_1063504 [Thelephora terrestris]|uniref:Uncharacterized protein n=1 Tax=Thelephora terrestris TaxID=56493 RepID=A0A9P6L749_9AGAM|nr:hypothetical protein BJ322DRAFT_1063504 [Thelephora terrestris]
MSPWWNLGKENVARASYSVPAVSPSHKGALVNPVFKLPRESLNRDVRTQIIAVQGMCIENPIPQRVSLACCVDPGCHLSFWFASDKPGSLPRGVTGAHCVSHRNRRVTDHLYQGSDSFPPLATTTSFTTVQPVTTAELAVQHCPKPQRKKGREGAISVLKVAIDALNLAKEVSSATPAKAVFGTAAQAVQFCP